MSFWTSIEGFFFIGYIDFKGRTTRAGYWWMTLILMIISFVPIIFFCLCSNWFCYEYFRECKRN
uniref:DUF805 domain-containing protein n=1 Tax=Streptococcus uberis TaxID=1349 RepID=UPI003CCFE4BE